jgi:hypothetical protein
MAGFYRVVFAKVGEMNLRLVGQQFLKLRITHEVFAALQIAETVCGVFKISKNLPARTKFFLEIFV